MEVSRRERNKQLCRARILKASRRLFSTKGYEQTTIEDVAEKAEISKATLYNYFTNKESLLLGIAQQEVDDVRHLIDSTLSGEPSSVVKLRQVMGLLVLNSIAYLPLSRKITSLNSSPDSQFYFTRKQMLAIFSELVEEGQARGQFRSDLPASQIIDLVMGVYLVTQFHWAQLPEQDKENCLSRLYSFFDLTMSGVLTDDGQTNS